MNKLQMFTQPSYCDFSSASSAKAGKNIMLGIYGDDSQAELLAIAGQQSLTINRSADSIEVSSKDTDGGWKSSIAGMKDWSISTGGLYVASDDSHRALSEAFEASSPVCVVVFDNSTGSPVPMFGGMASITEYSIEAPYDDAMQFSISLQGIGQLKDLIHSNEFSVTPVELTIAKGSSKTVTFAHNASTVTGTSTDDDITITINGTTGTIAVAAGAETGDSICTFSDGTDQVSIVVHIIASV